MPDTQLAAAFVQFGIAGLIGWMWLTERRAAAERERQLTELHERLLQERPHIDTLVRVVSENTRALAMLEAGHRSLTAVLERIVAGAAGVR